MMPRMSPAQRLSMMKLNRRPAFVERLFQYELADVMRDGTVSNLEAQAIARNKISEIVAQAREMEQANA